MCGNTAAKQKPCVVNTVAINSILFQKNYEAKSQPTQYEKNKIDKDHFEKKKQKKKKIIKSKKENYLGKYYSNPQCFKEKKLHS